MKYKNIKLLYNKTKNLTSNFAIFNCKLLKTYPLSLLILRHILCLNQKEFAKLIEISKSYLGDIEREKAKNISSEKIKIIIKNIKDEFKNINKEKILFKKIQDNYIKSYEYQILTSKRAKEIRNKRKKYPRNIKKLNKKLIKEWCKHLNTEKLALITALINGDGHIQLKRWRRQVAFHSKYMYEIKREIKNFKELFNIKGHVYLRENLGTCYGVYFISRELAAFLKSIGTISGNKTNKHLLVPKWIIKGDQKLKRAYLKGIFTTEGSITKERKNKRWRIRLSQYKNIKLKDNGKQYMEQIRTMLEESNIPSSPTRFCKINQRKDGTKSIGIEFAIEKKGFKNFYKCIGFNNINKQNRLIEAIKEV